VTILPGDLDLFGRFCEQVLILEDGNAMVLEPFQRMMLGDYFEGTRETLIIIPKKNGKTTLLAALALYHLCSTKDAMCVVGATSRDQASYLYEQAAGFVSRSEQLQRLVVVKGGYREIRSTLDRGRIRVLAADVDTADGVIPTLALVDELHRAKSTDLYGVFRDGLGPRQGQMITISTAGAHESSPLGEMRATARRLPGRQEGSYLYGHSEDGSFALHEWALVPESDTNDISLVKQANPASWQTEGLLRERRDSPSTRPWQWLRFACGIWVSGNSWWILPDEWELVHRVGAGLEPGDRITLGFDGARFHDATVLVACRLEDALLQPLGVWEKPEGLRGDWEVPAGQVDAAVAMAMEEFRVVRGYFDPPLWQTEIDAWAQEYGDEAVIRYFTKRGRMMDAVERFRTDVAAGVIGHTGDEHLSRHVLNAQTREVRGGYWLEKSRSGTAGNIDGAVACTLAYEARCDVMVEDAGRRDYAFL
jgi:phage terminase large subunit-like protein